jgi:membrane dipeptidase
MKYKFSFLLLSVTLFSVLVVAQPYKKVHESAIVIDSHNDFISTGIEKGKSFDQNLKGITHSDLSRMKEGGIDIQVFAIYCDGSYGTGKAFAFANREIDTLYATVARNPGKMMIVRNSTDLENAVKQKKLGAMIGVEGGHMIEDKISNLEKLYNRGVRYMTLTWNNSTSWASSAADERAKKNLGRKYGLNDFGEQVIRRMNELGMMVDVSHVGEKTFYDAIRISTKPVIASHSSVYSICPVPRNLTDNQIRAIGKNGGVIQINFYSAFIDSNFKEKNNAFTKRHQREKDSLLKKNMNDFYATLYLNKKYKKEMDEVRPPLTVLIDHLDHVVKLIGVDHVGLGSDFDGINSSPRELNDVADMPLITQELMKRGYSNSDIMKILGGNFIRVLKANENK